MPDTALSFMISLFLILVAPAAGSFARLVADRWPKRSVVFGSSRCDHCGRPVPMVCLLPILGFLVSKGRTTCCDTPLRQAHLAAEIGALVLAGWAFAVTPPPISWISAVLGWVLLTLTLVDLQSFRLPDWGTLGLVLAGLGIAVLGMTGPISSHLAGAVVGFLLLWGASTAYRAFRGIEGLGLGDAKLLAAAGAWCGVEGLLSVLFLGCVATLCHAVVLHRNGLYAQARTAFGPGLCFGFWVTWLHGPVLLSDCC